jgi:hypothetical protein
LSEARAVLTPLRCKPGNAALFSSKHPDFLRSFRRCAGADGDIVALFPASLTYRPGGDADAFRSFNALGTGSRQGEGPSQEEHLRGESELQPVCTGVAEIDPRQNLWRRAAIALQPGGSLRPDGPYLHAKSVSVTVLRSTAGAAQDVPEVRQDVVVAKGKAHASVVIDSFRSELRS